MINIDTDQQIPITRRVHCEFCNAVIDSSRCFQWIEGWAKRRRGGGPNAVTLARRSDIYACTECVDKLLHGISIGQTQLF